MGTAVGLSVGQVLPFLNSLRNAGYEGDVVLFVDWALGRALRRYQWEARVYLIRARQWLPFKLRLLGHPRALRFLWMPLQTALFLGLRAVDSMPLSQQARFALRSGLAKLIYTPMEARFVRYHAFLTSHRYARVLLTDVRDVLFQSDPFRWLPSSGLAVSDETASYTIATEPHNAEWITRAYGPEALEQIGRNRVSCVGVTYGDGEAILRYLRLFLDELMSLRPTAAGIGGADTAIHNMLLGTGRLEPVRHLAPLASPVATLNAVSPGDVTLSATGRLLNRDGSEPSVLHQYDRIPGMRGKLLQSLASSPRRDHWGGLPRLSD